jgi:TolB-like protein/Tfp pilus assembly protein PilF
LHSSLFQELKRRNVFRVAAAYVVISWVLVQVFGLAADSFEAPVWVMKMLITFLSVGFIVTLFFSWAFEITPEGLKKESELNSDTQTNYQASNVTAKKLDVITLIAIAVVIALMLIDRIIPNHVNQAPLEQSASSNNQEPLLSLESSSLESSSLESNPIPALGEKSIAVLPFDNRSADKNNAFFADGVHDDLLTQLAKVKEFKVISRTSVMEYRNTAKNLKQIGQELGVATIMEGAVQRSGKRVRINVQLINARTDEHLWAEIYDRELNTDNLFDIQTEISIAIANSLKTQLSPELLASGKEAPTQNLKAYDLYHQAKQIAINFNVTDLKRAIHLYRSVLNEDPDFKIAWAALAYTQVSLYWYSNGNRELLEEARYSLDKAKQIDADFPELYLAEGQYAYHGFLDYQTAISWFDKVIEVMPNNAQAYMYKGWASRRAGFWQDAVSNMKHSLSLNPRNILNWTEYAGTLQYLHRFTESQNILNKVAELGSSNQWYKNTLADQLLYADGNIHQALRVITGLQFVDQGEIVDDYINVLIKSKEFDRAKSIVNNQYHGFEIWRQSIKLVEDKLAEIEFLSGNLELARSNAKLALLRLAKLREELGDDYRLYLPEARMNAILGETDKVKQLIQRAKKSHVKDAVTQIIDGYEYSRVFALAGLVDETIALLEPQLSSPSIANIPLIRVDSAFDNIRSNKSFQAMLERHNP